MKIPFANKSKTDYSILDYLTYEAVMNLLFKTLLAIAAISAAELTLTHYSLGRAYASENVKQIKYKDLYKAVRRNDIKRAEKFFAKYPEYEIDEPEEKTGITALTYAVDFSRKDMTKLLLDHGADVNKLGLNNGTALIFSLAAPKRYQGDKRSEIVDLLLSKGADATITNDHGSTPLMVAVQQAYIIGTVDEDDIVDDVLVPLLNAGANINAKDKNGKTALYFAAKKIGSEHGFNAFKYLVSNGASTSYHNQEGYNLRDIAALNLRFSPEITSYFDQIGLQHTPAYSAVMNIRQAEEEHKVAAKAEGFCNTVNYDNLSHQQGKAVRYVFEQNEMRIPRRANRCYSKIKAIEKFSVRGNTIVRYEIDLKFPTGYNPPCLGQRNKYGDMRDFAAQMSCDVTKSIPAGKIIRYTGEAEI